MMMPKYTLLLFTTFFLFTGISQAQYSNVDVDLRFEKDDSYQAAQIFDSSGAVVATFCDPADCYTGTTRDKFEAFYTLGCLPDGNYTLTTYDRDDGEWEKNSFIKIIVAGVEVINRTHDNGFQTQDTNFTVSGGGACEPEINLKGNAANITNGSSIATVTNATDFGSQETGQTISQTFTIENLGFGDLNLTGNPLIQITGTGAADFSVTQLPSATVVAESATSFEITYTAGAAYGDSNAMVVIDNTDSNESPYTFAIKGSVAYPGFSNPEMTLKYFDFDTDSEDWTSNGTGMQWNKGTTIELGEGDYVYTNNYNDYPNSASTTYTSPVINTSGYANIVFSVDYLAYTGDMEDGLRVEYSANGGTTWSVLGSTTSGGVNWYNTTSVSGIATNAEAWTNSTVPTDLSRNNFMTASHVLPSSLFDNPNVRFRFVFGSDSSTTGDGVAIDNVKLTGKPFTYSDPTVGPIGETTDLSMWLKSDDLNGTDGSKITLWEDLASGNDAKEKNSNAPTYTNNPVDNVNFNPAVSFDRSAGQHMRGSGGFNSSDYWIVVRSKRDISNKLEDETMIFSSKFSEDNFTNDPSGLGWGPVSVRYSNEVLAHSTNPVSESEPDSRSYGRAFADASRTFNDVNIINVKNNPANDETSIYLNGRRIDNVTGQTTTSLEDLNFTRYLNTGYYLGVGRYTIVGAPFESHLDGQITELFSYRSRRSDLTQQKIYSYLAIKNGVSLHNPTTALSVDDHMATWDYIDSNNDVIWDASENSGFNYDVAAIGRDDSYNLNQKQSKSENSTSVLAIGLKEVRDLGSQNSNNFLADREFMIWGHNNGDLAAAPSAVSHTVGNAISVPTSMTRINRAWKIHEKTTGDIEEVEVRVESAAFSALGPITGDQERVLIIADDANFTTNLRTVFFKTDGIYERVKVDIDGVKYFTLGKADVVYSSQGLSFDGIDDYIEVMDGNDISTAFTVSAWIYSTGSNNTNSVKTILSKRTFADGFHFFLRDDNKLGVYWNNGSDQRLISNTILANNSWRHVAATYDGSKVILYIDGVKEKQANRTAPIVNSNTMAIGARKRGKNNVINNFKGKLDEVRVWNQALSQDQLRYVMNQEVVENTTFVSGKIMPQSVTKNEIETIPWNSLQAYYDMNTFIGTALNDNSSNKSHGQMAYEDEYTMTQQIAPLPYVTSGDGSWEDPSTWANGSELFIPGSTRVINGNTVKIDWNIVQTRNNIDINATDAILLGLFVQSNELSVRNDHGLTVSHYLKLDGIIDLVGESQLIQTDQSDFDPTSTGSLERDQQGTYDKFNYNYWSSPVSYINGSANNSGYDIETVMRDGTVVNNPLPLNFTSQSQGDGAPANGSNAATISGRWLYKYANLTSGTYSNWQYVGKDGVMNTAEGFTMKGTGSSSDQNYVFIGKPNNGDIQLDIFNGNDYLVGNPYPSAIDAHEFIADNLDLDGTIYMWEHWGGGSHNLAEYQGGYAMYNLSGGTPNATKGTSSPLVNQGGVATKIPGRYIPVAQGFFVTGINDGKINFSNSQRIFEKEDTSNSIFVAAPGSDNTNTSQIYESHMDERTKIRLGFNSPQGIHRQLLLTIDPNATMGYDRGYDGRLFDSQIDDMAFIIDGDYASIQGIPNNGEMIELPLYVKLGDQGYIEILIDHLENVSDDTEIFLLDKRTNAYYDLRSGSFNSPYLYTGTYKDRFVLTFKKQQTLSNDDTTQIEDIKVYTPASNQSIIIESSQLHIDSVELINLLGQRIKTIDTSSNTGRIEILRTGMSAGSYIVKMNNGDASQSRKIVLR